MDFRFDIVVRVNDNFYVRSKSMITKYDVVENPLAYPVRVKCLCGEILKGHIRGVKNDFPTVCLDETIGQPHHEFSWESILRHLNGVSQFLRI